ncbi:MAG: ABC transporter ATP-binding protein [Rhodoferax sp.]
MQSAIHVQNLTLRIGHETILQDINLQVPAGAVVGLVGRNGAGKSSLLRCLVGLEDPSSGGSTLLGCPSLHLTDTVRERLGYVAQTPDVFEWMEVMEMIKVIGSAYPQWNETRALALAVQLNLPVGRRISELSGGDQQKLSVVLAMAHNPELLLLDEPVSSLDPMTRREFMRALFTSPLLSDTASDAAGGAERPRTVLISSHLLTDLERVVTHVAFVREGRLQLFDAWDAMLEHLRLVPLAAVNGRTEGVVCRNPLAHTAVIDTRVLMGHATSGRAMGLDELFLELNT